MSTAFHPQTDGQTERTNRTLEEMLRHYVNWRHSDWDEYLSTLEMAFNNARQASTGFSPHYLNYGQEMRMPLDAALRSLRGCSNPDAAERIDRLRQDLEKAKAAIRKAQERQGYYADQSRRDVKFQLGDKVLLSTEHLKMVGEKRAPKFAEKYIGPFEIKRIVGDNAYELALPPQMEIHPVLNISRLKPYHEGHSLFPDRAVQNTRPPPEIREDGAEVYEVKRILASRGSGSRKQYYVVWEGYPLWEATWVPQRELAGAAEAVEEFESSLMQ